MIEVTGLTKKYGATVAVGRAVQPFLPWANANNFLAEDGGEEFHWGSIGKLVYFTAFTAIDFGAAVFVTTRRDA